VYKGDERTIGRNAIFLLTDERKPIIINSFQRYRGEAGRAPVSAFSLIRESPGDFLESKILNKRDFRDEVLISTKEGTFFMAKRRGNPNWGKPEPIGPITPTITEFEQVVNEYKLSPDQYLRSTRLREWARRNKNSKYIPEPLLEAWGFEIESTL
jgi:hypothetical protein